MKVIPAIDIIEGKCVRLSMGDYKRKTEYEQSPLEVAKSLEEAGLSHLHLVDLDGAKAGKVLNHEVIRDICGGTNLIVDFGGGVRSRQDLESVFESGAAMVTGGSIAVKDRKEFESWIRAYPGKIILGADVKNGKVAVSAWQEESDLEVFDFLEYYMDKGIRRVVCTEVERDGMMTGAAEDLYRSILARFPEIELVASGGIRNAEDLALMSEIGMWGSIVGKAFHDGVMSPADLRQSELA